MMFRRSLCHLIWCSILATAVVGCGRHQADGQPLDAQPLFRDVAASAGIEHTHHKPALDPKLSNIMSWMASVGASIAVADVDGDGFQDLYFTSSRKGDENRLYRNLGDGTFREQPATGIADMNGERGASMDAIWGDVDNDGDADLYLVRWGYDGLFLNRGDGTFVEVTEERFRQRDGSPGTQWANGNAAVFLDFDLDGRLDIYVGNYFNEVDLWDLESTRIMHDDFEVARNGGENYLYHQQPDGTFVEVASQLGINDPGWTLAVGVGDLDGNGIPDLYCADDFGPDQLYLGQADGSFLDATEMAIGFDTKKGMNAELGDFNNDGWLDIYVTNITTAEYLQEGNMLWQNLGPAEGVPVRFADISLESGTYDGGWGWGAKFFDFDNDGDLDIVAANGFISAGEGSYWYDLASWTVTGEDAADAANWPPIGDRSFSGYETERLWRNEGTMFTEQAASLGLATERDGRGIALVDYDDDGDLDVVIATQDHQPHLFHNSLIERQTAETQWLRVVLEIDPTTGVNRDGIGTRVSVRAGDRLFVRERDGGNGYSGHSDPRLHFGLGGIDRVDSVEVRWPDGGRQYVDAVATGSELRIRQDPTAYVEPRFELPPPEATQLAVAQVASTGEAQSELSDDQLARMLGDLEARLSLGFDRPTANDYRRLAADHGAHDRAIEFLAARAADGASTRHAWRVELSLAYVDKIPACGGLAAIVCKGRNAQQGLDALDQVLGEEPSSWLATYSRGMNHLHWPKALRHSADAARDLEKAVALQAASEAQPWHLRTWVALGQAYAKNGNVGKARDAWRRGLEVFPEAAELRDYLAIADDDALRRKVDDVRSLEQPIDTDIRFYSALL